MDETRTLQNNQLAKFILRIDIDKSSTINFEDVANRVAADYSTKKIEYHEHYHVNIDDEHNHANVNRTRFPRFVMTNGDGIYLKLGTFDKSIIIESNKYKDNTVYKGKIAKVIQTITELAGPEVGCNRIGLRYVNSFQCETEKDIARIFNANETKSIKVGLSKENVARVLMIIETNINDHQIRVQYGVPNRFYPSNITRPDLMLDIDVSSSGLQTIDEWEEVIVSLNHEAYETFRAYVKESYVNKLK
jgi:uncharacterized protein (TIGR04255 family)